MSRIYKMILMSKDKEIEEVEEIEAEKGGKALMVL